MPQQPEGGEPQQPQGETPNGDDAAAGAPRDAMPEDGQAPEPPEGFGGQDGTDGAMPDLPEGEVPTMPEDGQMPEPPEGFDGQMPERPEGAEGGQMPEGGRGGMDGMGGAGGPMGANASEECLIQINGGTVTIQAGGDAVDSNGYIEVTGGMLLGASSGNGDSALDYEYGATITGGTVLLAGSAGMAESFTEGTQPFALVMAQGSAGAKVTVADAAGTTVVDYAAPVAFQCVVVSAPQLAEGDAGTVSVDGAATEFTASTTPASGGMGGQRGGMRGDFSDGEQPQGDGGRGRDFGGRRGGQNAEGAQQGEGSQGQGESTTAGSNAAAGGPQGELVA